MTIRRHFVDGPFGQVHYRTCGNPAARARPLLCLHQSPKSSREFVTILSHLANQQTGEERYVIAVDSPGHGESDVPLAQADATIPNYARSAWAVVDALGLLDSAGTIDILGHHTGAKVATEMAWQRPGDVAGIVMVSALVLTSDEQAEFEHMFTEVPLDEAGTRFQGQWDAAIKHRGPGVTLEMLAASVAENNRAGDAYEWGHKAAFAYNAHFPDRVATLDHAITVLNPNDMLFELTPRVAPLLKNGRVVDYPDWGFGFMDVDPQGAAKAVLEAL